MPWLLYTQLAISGQSDGMDGGLIHHLTATIQTHLLYTLHLRFCQRFVSAVIP